MRTEEFGLLDLVQLFPLDEAAEKWFEEVRWLNGRACLDCGSLRTTSTRHRHRMPHRYQEMGCTHYNTSASVRAPPCRAANSATRHGGLLSYLHHGSLHRRGFQCPAPQATEDSPTEIPIRVPAYRGRPVRAMSSAWRPGGTRTRLDPTGCQGITDATCPRGPSLGSVPAPGTDAQARAEAWKRYS